MNTLPITAIDAREYLYASAHDAKRHGLSAEEWERSVKGGHDYSLLSEKEITAIIHLTWNKTKR